MVERRIVQSEERTLSPYKIHELLIGICTYPLRLPHTYSGYGNPHCRNQDEDLAPYITDAMRRDWIANRDKLLKLWNGEATEKELFGHVPKPWLNHSHEPDERPWASEMFDDDHDSPTPY